MGVYIKGMEMPTSCAGCPIDSDSCELWTQLPVTLLSKVRHEDCPLVPVPPHGKLVEVADVKELFEKHFGDDQIAFQLIDSVPVIIPPKSKEQQDLEDLVERLNREGIAP